MIRFKNILDNRIKLSFIDPNTGYKFGCKYKDLQAMIDHIVAYRRINGLDPIVGLLEVVEQYLVSLPENSKESLIEEVGGEIPLGVKQYVSGAKAFLNAAAALCRGDECFVSDEIAEKRAERCVGCRYNTKGVRDHNLLEKIARKVSSIMTKPGTTKYDGMLGQCTQCGCDLLVKVRYKKDMFTVAPEVEKILPNNDIRDINGKLMTCWQIDKDL